MIAGCVPLFTSFQTIQILRFSRSEYCLFLKLYIMSVVVEQTLPYTAVELKLEDPTRWARLFPLMRPSIKVIATTNEQAVVVDTALAGSKNVLIAAIGSVGNFSSKMLSESHLAAFTTERPGNPTISAEELQTILKNNGFPTQNGVVVLRSSTNPNLRTSRGIIEFSVEGGVKFDHVLSLLSAMKSDIKYVVRLSPKGRAY